MSINPTTVLSSGRDGSMVLPSVLVSAAPAGAGGAAADEPLAVEAAIAGVVAAASLERLPSGLEP
jgi:hypothetical protein